MNGEIDTERVQIEFIRSAIHYFIAGRFSAIAHLFPVSGNLLHHAIEMLLKGVLAKNHTLNQLAGFRHDLVSIWAAFKKVFTYSDLSQFDSVIEKLHRFERIRYPDKLLVEGMSAQFARFRDDFVKSENGNNPKTQVYNLVMEEIDDLVTAIFTLSKMNPLFYCESLSDEARHFLLRHNAHSFLQTNNPSLTATE